MTFRAAPCREMERQLGRAAANFQRGTDRNAAERTLDQEMPATVETQGAQVDLRQRAAITHRGATRSRNASIVPKRSASD